MAQTKTHNNAETTREHTGHRSDETREGSAPDDNRSDNLRDSPMMARLLDALEKGTDIGHYGQFTFMTVARHFMDENEIVALIAKQPNLDEERARAQLRHIVERDYNPPRRERILEHQGEQAFSILPDLNDPDSGNIYRELRFPDGLYEHINDYYEDKTEVR